MTSLEAMLRPIPVTLNLFQGPSLDLHLSPPFNTIAAGITALYGATTSGETEMLSMRHFLVPLAIAALAFFVAQVLPGAGIFVALFGSFIWIAHEQRRAKHLQVGCCRSRNSE
jgi:hypothetical protein